MQSIKQLISNTITYGISSVLGRMLSYLLVPMHTYILCPEDFGVITEFYSYIAIAQIVYSFGIETAYYRFLGSIPNFKNFSLSLIILISIILSIMILAFTGSIASFIKVPNCEKYIYSCIIILLIDSWLVVPFAHFRLHGRVKLFSTIKFLQILINIFLNVILIYITSKTNCIAAVDRVHYIFLANAISNGIFIPICIYCIGGFNLFFSLEITKKVIRYSLPIVYIGLITVINDVLSRLAIKYWLPPHFYGSHNVEYILGVFSACQKIAVLMSIGIQAFRYAVEPMFFSQAKGSRSWYNEVMYWFIVAGCIIMFVVSINLDTIANIFLRKEIYKEALRIVPYILFTNLLAGIYYNLSAWFKICDKTKYGIFIASVGCITALILTYFLIPHIGYWGSIYASLLSYFIMIFICYVYGQKFYPIPYSIRVYSIYLLITILVIYFIKLITYSDILTSYICNAFLSILISGAFFYTSLAVSKKIL